MSLEKEEEKNKDPLPDDASLHFNLGVSLWEKREESKQIEEKAAEHFMMAAKLNPQNGDSFRYLGHYYAHVSPEPQRAIKCYQRAVALNPDDFDSGEAICNLLDKSGKESLVFSVCVQASEMSSRAFWAFRRLGYIQAHRKKWSEAIQSLQHAIRGFPTCADLWESLGLAYQRMGMFTAALKSYSKAVELEDSRVFALVESGNISLMLGSFRKGAEQFQHALRISPNNVSANYGLASALLGLANECISMGALRWGATLLEEGSEVASRGASLSGNMSCVWKLHGDIQLMYARCFPWMEEASFLQVDANTLSLSIRSWKQSCFLAASHACQLYQRALHLSPWQANLYTDVAIASDLAFSLKSHSSEDSNMWLVAEKMCFGSILLEGDNHDFWVALGCLSDLNSLKQHAFIRGLHLNVSLAVAWAYLGKLYRQEGELQLAQQFFDQARSINPSLGLPWAGMAADSVARCLSPSEAYKCCLRAVQIFPLAEFQLGLAKISLDSSELLSSEVFGAIQQALLRAPEYPETHNLNGLVCESRSDYEKAITSYRLARCALTFTEKSEPYFKYITINLARSLCAAGHASDAVEECEYLRQNGQLDVEGLQIYALCLWQLSKYDAALSITRELGAKILLMEKDIAASSISFICRILYFVSGQESTITSILKMPKELFQSSKISFIISAIHILDPKDQLVSVVSKCRSFVTSSEEIIEMHILVALGKLIKHQPKDCLAIPKSVVHLQKALHMYPNSSAIRNLLSYLLLSGREWVGVHLVTRCSLVGSVDHQQDEGWKSSWEVFGAGTIACHGARSCNGKFTALTSGQQLSSQSGSIQKLQKVLHQEPWNAKARYLLTMNYLQKARVTSFLPHICSVLERMITIAISTELQSSRDTSFQYQQYMLRLCMAELNFQLGNNKECLRYTKSALGIPVHTSYLFFAHLSLCRAYAANNDIANLKKEYIHCLQLGTDLHIGWISLKLIDSSYKLQTDPGTLNTRFEDCFKDNEVSRNMWTSVFSMVQGLINIRLGDFVAAEEFLSQACSVADSVTFLLIHGSICMSLAKQKCESQYILRAIKSLRKAKEVSPDPVPFVSLLLGQAEASLGSREEWENNIHDEWFSWNSVFAEMIPAELLFQMYLLSRPPTGGIKSYSSMDFDESSVKWMLRAIHQNPSCLRYWKLLQMDCQ